MSWEVSIKPVSGQQPICPWYQSTTPPIMGGKKRTACYFQFGAFWPLQRMFSIWMLSALTQTNALVANTWKPNSSAPVFASANARNSSGLDTKAYQWSTLAVQNFESKIWIDFLIFNKPLSHELILTWDCS